ncbi:MAG: hypothetical protein K0M45_03830 [Candidatus Paracaedibacteraceae bacterium]|nr:hypothetical protein [Candidatus Paracaedibacteraceae bacterium]
MGFKFFSIVFLISTATLSKEGEVLLNVGNHILFCTEGEVPQSQESSVFESERVQSTKRKRDLDLSRYETLMDFKVASASAQSLNRRVRHRPDNYVALKPKKLSAEEQLKDLLVMAEKKGGLPYEQTRKAVELMRTLYIRLENKSYKGNLTDYKNFLLIGEQLLKSIEKCPLQAIYFKEYTSLIKFLTGIGNTVYITSHEKKQFLSKYVSFYAQMEDFMQQRILTSRQQISYYRVCLRILNSILQVTDNLLEQKNLLDNIIVRNQDLLFTRKTLENCQDLTLLFDSYNRLYTLETDRTKKIKLLDAALDWGDRLKKNYKVSTEVRQFIKEYETQYKKRKKDVIELPSLSFNFSANSERRVIVTSLDNIDNYPGDFFLPNFKSSLDDQMLRSLERHG